MKFTYEQVDASVLIEMALRQSDIIEMQATSGLGPKEGLMRSISVSDWWRAAINEEGKIVAVFGVAPVDLGLPGVGSPWFLATDEAEEHPQHVYRQAKRWVEMMQEQYPVLVNFVDVRHKSALQWVSWLGFEFVQDQTPGKNGETLIQIIRTKGGAACATR